MPDECRLIGQGGAERFDAVARLAQGFVVRRVGQTEIRRQTERFALNDGDARFFQKRGHEIRVRGDCFAGFRLFADASRHGRIQIKRAFGRAAGDAFARVQTRDDHIATAFENVVALFQKVHGRIQRDNARRLTERRDVRRALRLDFVHRFDDRFVARRVSDAPARHGKRFRQAVDRQRARFDFLVQRRDADRFKAVVHDVLVNFVAHDPDVRMLFQNGDQRQQFFFRVRRARRVRRRIQHQPLRFRRNGGFQFVSRQFEAVFLFRFDKNAFAAVQGDHGGIRHPVRRGDDHFVAVVYCRGESVVQHAFAARADRNLIGRVIQIVFAFQFAANGFAEFDRTRDGGVFRFAVVQRFFGGFDNVRGGLEIGFADAQPDNVNACRFQFFRSLRDGECRRGFDR